VSAPLAYDGQQLHFVSAVTVMGSLRLVLIASKRWVFMPFPEKGA